MMNNPNIHARMRLALALSAVLASGVALAQQASPTSTPSQPASANGGMHERMMQLDTDHDGRVSRQEAAAKPELAQKFDKLDANRDGFLGRDDFQARNQQKRDECFANADTDKDGKLSRGEYDAAQKQCHSQHGGMRGPRQGGDQTPPAG